MLVLGIDPGIAITGFGLIRDGQDGELEPVDYGVITTPAGMPTARFCTWSKTGRI